MTDLKFKAMLLLISHVVVFGGGAVVGSSCAQRSAGRSFDANNSSRESTIPNSPKSHTIPGALDMRPAGTSTPSEDGEGTTPIGAARPGALGWGDRCYEISKAPARITRGVRNSSMRELSASALWQ